MFLFNATGRTALGAVCVGVAAGVLEWKTVGKQWKTRDNKALKGAHRDISPWQSVAGICP